MRHASDERARVRPVAAVYDRRKRDASRTAMEENGPRVSAVIETRRYRSNLAWCAALFVIAILIAGCGSNETPRETAERNSREAARRLDKQAKKAKVARASGWGHFSGPVETRWENNGFTMVLLNELRYTDPYGQVWWRPPARA